MGQKEKKNHADLAKTVLMCMCICVAGDSSGRKAEEEAKISKTRWIYRLWIVHLYSVLHCAAEEESISSTVVGEQSKRGGGRWYLSQASKVFNFPEALIKQMFLLPGSPCRHLLGQNKSGGNLSAAMIRVGLVALSCWRFFSEFPGSSHISQTRSNATSFPRDVNLILMDLGRVNDARNVWPWISLLWSPGNYKGEGRKEWMTLGTDIRTAFLQN